MIEDPSVFLADWGEAGTLAGVAVTGIFGSPYAVAPMGEAGISTAEPRFLLPSSDVPAAASDDEADAVLELPAGALERFPGTGTPFRYLVTEVQPDGTGWSTLMLSVHHDQSPNP